MISIAGCPYLLLVHLVAGEQEDDLVGEFGQDLADYQQLLVAYYSHRRKCQYSPVRGVLCTNAFQM